MCLVVIREECDHLWDERPVSGHALTCAPGTYRNLERLQGSSHNIT